MRIVIDARMLSYTGIGRYVHGLVDLIPPFDKANQYFVLLTKADFDRWTEPSDNVQKVLADYPAYSLGEQIRLPRQIRQLQPDIVHFPHFSTPLFYLRNYVVTVHDLTLRDFPTRRGNSLLARAKFGVRYWAMRLSLHKALAHAAAIMVPTNFVKEQVEAGWPARAARISVTYEAASNLVNDSDRPVKPQPNQLLYVGNYYPSKNISSLIDAIGLLAALKPEVKLTLVGKKDSFAEQLEAEIGAKNLSANIEFRGYVTDAELSKLYQNAALFVFPSLSEGFGLPPLEAMAAGCPVISSNASCMPEVLGNAAAYFGPHDPKDIANKIQALLNDPNELERLRQAGLEQVKKYSWRKMAEETLAVYKEVLGHK